MPAGQGDRTPEPRDAGLGRPRGHGGGARLDQNAHRSRPRHSHADRSDGVVGRRPEGRARVHAELEAEELRARLDLTHRGVGFPACPQASDQEDMRVLVEGIEPHEVGGVVAGPLRVSAGKECERRLVQHRGGRPGNVAALVLQPVLERRARSEGHAVEELVPQARERDGLHPRALPEDGNIDEGSLAKHEPNGISTYLGVRAELASERRERGPQSSQWVVGLGEEKAGEALARRRDLCSHEVGEQAPVLASGRGRDLQAAAEDTRRAEQLDRQIRRRLHRQISHTFAHTPQCKPPACPVDHKGLAETTKRRYRR